MYQEIINYYDYTLPLYRIFYHKKTYGIHYGFWDESVKSHEESILNANKFMAEVAKISSHDYVLDAGCGVGGSSIWLAKHLGTQCVGITLSKNQLEKAKSLTQKFKTEHLTEFFRMNYLKTGFKDGTFTVIWANESICYCENKKDFLVEAYRLLRPGGRLIVADGFQLREPINECEEKDLNTFLKGWVLPNLANENKFENDLLETGFKTILKFDKVAETMRSAKKIYNIGRIGYPLAYFTEQLGLTPSLLTDNNRTAIVQYKIIKEGIMGHRVFYAEKPY